MSRRPHAFLSPALSRVSISLVLGAAAFAASALRIPRTGATLVGWDIFALSLLGLSLDAISRADAHETRRRAGSEDPGRTLVYAIVLATSSVSLLAATLLVRNPRTLPPDLQGELAALCLVTVAFAWTATQVAFTYRYAHLYYRDDKEGIGGIDFPGGAEPAYFDFAYFAFTIGMCFQVSDVCVTSHQIRRAVLLHAVISFAYNSVILAFVLNLVFGVAA
jgi:uncharacterized membrane protein